MNARYSRYSLAALLVVLSAVALLSPDRDRRQLSETTYGTIPQGYGALFDLLQELDVPVRRNLAPPAELARNATVWWLAAPVVCAPNDDGDALPWPGAAWSDRGGTALLFLDGPPGPAGRPCALSGELELPPLQPYPAATADGDSERGADAAEATWHVRGDILAGERQLPARPTWVFTASGTWDVAATLDGAPWILARPLGAGRVVAIADGQFFSNRLLDSLDAAPLAADLTRAYGTPLFDEYAHGMRRHAALLPFLATSPAAPLFLGIAMLALAFFWRGALLPPLRFRDAASATPALQSFVTSLASLYARSRDRRGVLAAYGAMTAAQLRSHLRLDPGAGVDQIAARLPRVGADRLRALLAAPDTAPTQHDLQRRLRALDALLEEGTEK